MLFYLGAHHTNWLGNAHVPLFVSRRRLQERVKLPEAVCRWALDSGGFSELTIHGEWSIGAQEYVDQVEDYADKIGKMDFAAIQDWMCEPQIINGDAKSHGTGLSVLEHQRRTVQSMLDLTELAPHLPWAPVLQGWEIKDYYKHIEMYAEAGIDLHTLDVVGLGSVCRRQHTTEIEALIIDLHKEGLKLHGFGFKIRGLQNVAPYLQSADSMAWSYQARRRPTLPECVERFKLEGRKGHKNCANCQVFALQWRGRVMQTLRNAHAQNTQRVNERSGMTKVEVLAPQETSEDSGLQLQGDDLRVQINELVSGLARNMYRLGHLLKMVDAGDEWGDWGYASFEEYLEVEIGYKKRAAQDYMRIAGTFDGKLSIPYEEVGQIGWSKLKVVEPVCTDEKEARKWLKHAEKHPRSKLETMVRREKAIRAGKDPDAATVAPAKTRVQHDTTEELEGVHQTTDTPNADASALDLPNVPSTVVNRKGEEEEALHKFGPVYLRSEQWKNVMAAMGVLGQVANTQHPAVQLDLMATEINNTLADEADGGILQRLEWYKTNLERLFEIQITIVVPPGSKLRKMARLDEEQEDVEDVPEPEAATTVLKKKPGKRERAKTREDGRPW